MKGNLRKKLIAIAMVAVMAGSTFSGVASALTVSNSSESTYEENIKDVNTGNGDNISTPDEVEPTTSGNISTPDEVQPTTSGSISTPDEPIIEPTTESSTIESSTEPTTESSTVESSTEPTTESSTEPTTESSTVESSTEPTTESSTVESSTEPTTESSTEPTTESSTVPSKPSVVKVKSIKLSKNNVILNKGKSFILKVTSITPSDATNKEVTWNSSNKKIATVDKNGKVVARGKGTCRITVSATDVSGVRAVCKVTVKQLVTSIKLNRSVINLKKKGNKATLKATVNPRNANNKRVTWKVQKPKNVSYNTKKGIVKALRNNSYSWVTVISKDGSKKSAKALVVVGRKANKVEIGKNTKKGFVKLNNMNIVNGKSYTFSKRVSNKNKKPVAYGGVTWKSSNPKVLTVDNNGKIKTIKVGSAYVTATTMDGSRKSVKCKVRVIKLVSKIIFNKNNKYDVDYGKSITLKASVEPSDASIKTLKWKSSNTKVLTVNKKGKVTAKGLGSAVITASATDGSGVKVSRRVNVNVTMNTKLTCDEFQGNRKYVDRVCTELNNYFKSCGAIINPKLVNTSQYFVTTSDSFTDGGSMKDFLVETVGIWTCQRAKDAVEQEGWKNFQGEGMRDNPKFIAFLDKIEEIGSSVFPTYDPNKLLDPEWNGWKPWIEHVNKTDGGLKVNVYVYVHQKDVLNDGSVSYEIRMSHDAL